MLGQASAREPDEARISIVVGCCRDLPLQPESNVSGFFIGFARLGVFLSNALALAAIPLFVVYMHRFQIGPEERGLASLFGQEYLA
jgi:hypothetical protein